MVIYMNSFFTPVLFPGAITLCISILFSSTLSAEEKPFAPETIQDVTIVSAEQAIEMIISNPELVVIDSRKKTEYLKGHIEGSINILNTRLTREDLERVSPDKSREILFYCNGTRCLRSSDSINKARGWGYTNLIWFRGGWKEWTEKRLPVVTD
jgi:rhodanese-related sulfurtransferase